MSEFGDQISPNILLGLAVDDKPGRKTIRP